MERKYVPGHLKITEEELKAAIEKLPAEANTELRKLALSLVDLTTLEGKDTDQKVEVLCRKAVETGVAAVCVYPVFAATAKAALSGSKIKVASVAGAFPSGQLPLNLRLEEAKYALLQGADEIDMVISRGKLMDGDHDFVFNEIAAFKEVCGNAKLKVILETGELENNAQIRLAAEIAIQAGADFIKTSTGKISGNATLPAVYIMLRCIKQYFDSTGKKVGIKPSGGISDGNTAAKYLQLTADVLGKEWLQPSLFRFGASRLVDTLIAEIKGGNLSNTSSHGY
jgi:deoxyribose-phosphate aldolase